MLVHTAAVIIHSICSSLDFAIAISMLKLNRYRLARRGDLGGLRIRARGLAALLLALAIAVHVHLSECARARDRARHRDRSHEHNFRTEATATETIHTTDLKLDKTPIAINGHEQRVDEEDTAKHTRVGTKKTTAAKSIQQRKSQLEDGNEAEATQRREERIDS